jgi:hypothetical protein
MVTIVKNRIILQRRVLSSCVSVTGSVFNSSLLEKTGLETAGLDVVELEAVGSKNVWLESAEFSGAITILLLH